MDTDITPIANPAGNQAAAPAPSSAGFAIPLQQAKAIATDEARQDRKALTEALAEEIVVRRAQEAHASKAAEIAARAKAAEAEAAKLVEQLQAGIDAAALDATLEHAEALATAFRMNDPLPDAPAAIPATNSEALTAALARLAALHAAACRLADEADAARGAANDSARACRDIVDRILAMDAKALADEWIAATHLCWQLQDCLTGIARIGDGALLPRDFQSNLLDQIDRRKAVTAMNALMIERHNYDRHLDNLSAAQEKLWLDFGRRLMNDPAATFGEELPQ
jgi:hypothetical protein